MTNELEILNSVEEENSITQRELAKRTGLSLGAVNVLIKRLIQKGLLKIERINTKTLKYILTPQGMLEKARLTYQYIVMSYNHIAGIEDKLEKIISCNRKTLHIVLYGEKDELYDIITAKLRSMGKHFRYIADSQSLLEYNKEEYIIITWHPDHITEAERTGINSVNILNRP